MEHIQAAGFPVTLEFVPASSVEYGPELPAGEEANRPESASVVHADAIHRLKECAFDLDLALTLMLIPT